MKCPNCFEFLPARARSCDCGWEKEKKGSNATGRRSILGFCEWENNGKQCKLLGTMSPSVDGSGPWFCRWHWRNRNNPIEANDRILFMEFIEKDKHSYGSSPFSFSDEEAWTRSQGHEFLDHPAILWQRKRNR